MALRHEGTMALRHEAGIWLASNTRFAFWSGTSIDQPVQDLPLFTFSQQLLQFVQVVAEQGRIGMIELFGQLNRLLIGF